MCWRALAPFDRSGGGARQARRLRRPAAPTAPSSAWPGSRPNPWAPHLDRLAQLPLLRLAVAVVAPSPLRQPPDLQQAARGQAEEPDHGACVLPGPEARGGDALAAATTSALAVCGALVGLGAG